MYDVNKHIPDAAAGRRKKEEAVHHMYQVINMDQGTYFGSIEFHKRMNAREYSNYDLSKLLYVDACMPTSILH